MTEKTNSDDTIKFYFQPYLFDELIEMLPLKESDFEDLFKVASDPLLWEQHPNKERYKDDVFRNFFTGAMESGGALLVKDKRSGKVIGSSRYYGYNEEERSISVGYTFVSRECWGKLYNYSMKKLMLDHAFEYTERVYFHIGEKNIRSQKAILKLGAIKIDELDMKYYGEEEHRNFIYLMGKGEWEKLNGNK